jgi:hypothetical protein
MASLISSFRLPLSSLTPQCHVSESRIPYFGASKPAVVVECGCHGVVVVGPASLQTLVNIDSADKALEYVRFFTVRERADLFGLDGMIEIAGFGDAGTTADGRFLISEEYRKTFHFEPATVERDGQATRQFAITRTVVSGNGKVEQIQEVVSGDGNYAIRWRKPLLANSSAIGILNIDPL